MSALAILRPLNERVRTTRKASTTPQTLRMVVCPGTHEYNNDMVMVLCDIFTGTFRMGAASL
jgi:hypothetical protein